MQHFNVFHRKNYSPRLCIYLCLMSCLWSSCKNSASKEIPIGLVTHNKVAEALLSYKFPYNLKLPVVTDIPNFKNDSSLIYYLQHHIDSISWLSFIAINWKANENGMTDTTAKLGTSKNVVWKHWMPSTSIYNKTSDDPNFKPVIWKEGMTAEGIPFNAANSSTRIFPKLSKADQKSADDHPVIDQNNNFTYYEVLYNREAYDYVVQSQLYNKIGQQNFTKTWPIFHLGLQATFKDKEVNLEKTFQRAYFPVGGDKDTTFSFALGNLIDTEFDTVQLHFQINPGAAIIKTAWKILIPGEDSTRFFTRRMIDAVDSLRLFGLVGMHLIHKVAESTQWTWSTFEHIDNAPDLGSDGFALVDSKTKYNYFDPQKARDSALYNKVPPIKSNSNLNFRIPTQVVRQNKISEDVKNLNSIFRNKIKKESPSSPWQYYQLIGTQWPFDPNLFTYGRNYKPVLLANTIMETYNQKTSSCMSCHKSARFLSTKKEGSGFNADFIFGMTQVK